MMKRIFFILMLVSFAGHGWSQETNRHQFSSAPETSRYQIVQSELGARTTLLIDKYTGSVFQIVQSSTGLFWQLISAEDHTDDKATPDKVNYQVFTSGLGINMTFLLNVNTGATWQLVEDSELDELWWKPLE